MPSRAVVRSLRGILPSRRVAVAVAVIGVALVAAAAATPAVAASSGVHRGPADFVSVAITGGNPDFGYLKEGNSVTRTISLQNDGRDGWSMDPAPLAALAAPFTLVSTTLVA